MGGKPGAPGLQRAAQQGHVVQILRLQKRAMLTHKGRRGHGRDHIFGQAHVLHVGIAPGAKAHGQVGVLGHHIEQRDRDLQGQVNLRIGIGELAQARNDHRAGKGGRDRQTKLAFAGCGTGAGKLLQDGQAFAHMGQIFTAFGGERKVGATEQLGANNLFQLTHPVADRAGGDKQLFRGLGHAAQTRQRLKGQQALDGRDACGAHKPPL